MLVLLNLRLRLLLLRLLLLRLLLLLLLLLGFFGPMFLKRVGWVRGDR